MDCGPQSMPPLYSPYGNIQRLVGIAMEYTHGYSPLHNPRGAKPHASRPLSVCFKSSFL